MTYSDDTPVMYGDQETRARVVHESRGPNTSTRSPIFPLNYSKKRVTLRSSKSLSAIDHHLETRLSFRAHTPYPRSRGCCSFINLETSKTYSIRQQSGNMPFPRNNLSAFLSHSKQNLTLALKGLQKTTIVIGNESAGTNSRLVPT